METKDTLATWITLDGATYKCTESSDTSVTYGTSTQYAAVPDYSVTWSSPSVTVHGAPTWKTITYDEVDVSDGTSISNKLQEAREQLEKSERHVEQLEEDIQYLNDKLKEQEEKYEELSNDMRNMITQFGQLFDIIQLHDNHFTNVEDKIATLYDKMISLKTRQDNLEDEIDT